MVDSFRSFRVPCTSITRQKSITYPNGTNWSRVYAKLAPEKIYFFPFFFSPPLFNETMAYSQRQVSFNALVKCCNDAGTYEINEQNTCTVVMVERCKQIFEVTWCEMTLCEISEHGENREICDWMIISPLLQSLSLFFRVTKKRSTEWANTELSNVWMKARYKVDLLPNAFLRLGVFRSS